MAATASPTTPNASSPNQRIVIDFNLFESDPSDVDAVFTDDETLPQLTAPVQRSIEPVGLFFERSFFDEVFWNHAVGILHASSTATALGVGPTKKKDPTNVERTKINSKRTVVLKDEELTEDWYEIIGLGERGDGASMDEVRTAYRKACLETHPDKHGGSDLMFKKVQRAFEILSDPDARRTFDSSRPFDDSIPTPSTDVKNDNDFYKVYAPIFSRNARWSTIQPVPELGADFVPSGAASVAQVRKFYDFWMSFSSWRDFTHEAEVEEISEGMDRYEKRFITRENERALSKHRRQEAKRIRTLVEDAMRLDPRLRRLREMEDAERKAVQDKREELKRKREEEEYARQQAELAKQEAIKQAAKAEVERKKMMLRDAFKVVLDFFTEKGLLDSVDSNLLLPDKVRRPNIQWLISKTDSERVQEDIVDKILAEGPTTPVVTAAAAPAPAAASPGGKGKGAPAAPPAEAAKEVPVVKLFNDLIAATEKRLGMNRYGEPISASGEVARADAAKDASPIPKDLAKAPPCVWSPEDVTNLRKAIGKFPPGTMERWRRIAQALRDKFTEEQVLAKTKELEQFGSSVAPAPVHVDPAAGAGGSPGGAGAAAAPIASLNTEQDGGDWTVKQQKQLEQGLREMQAYKEKDKFIKIAAFVEGKTAAQCFERYKYIVSLMKKK